MNFYNYKKIIFYLLMLNNYNFFFCEIILHKVLNSPAKNTKKYNI